MNEFLHQFVVESRELVSQAVEGLLKLEQSPQDAEGLDAVFRAFHTLKGGAGIVEFAAMERAVHAAEEVLGEARSGQRSITATLVGSCVASLDLVGEWLEIIAATGALPHGDPAADAIVRRFAELGAAKRSPTAAATAPDEWVESLLSRHPPGETSMTAIRYTPAVDSFFQGEDPAARIAGIPELLAQELVPAKAWPSLSELDPYACNLVLMALSGATAEAVRAHLQGYVGDCEIVELGRGKGGEPGISASARVQELIRAQLALLAVERTDQWPGRVASAGRVAANALRATGRDPESRQIRAATERSVAERSPDPLRRALEDLSRPSADTARARPAPETRAAESTLRVDAVRIDALVRLTGELTTAKNALAHTTARAEDGQAVEVAALKDRLHEFDRLIGRLQRAVLALRVLPLRSVLQRFPRVLREMSRTLGKPVTLHIEGDHTEADKAIVDMLFEPLLHALRNAVDHGIENPARRRELGKPLVGSISIRARRDSDRVIIEVEDDGSGVDLARVREVALNRGIVTADTLQAMTDPQIVELIFAPGFSTAATVSELSGRGVGLDAVRAAIQRVGGQVTLLSRPGLGTTLLFSLPFSVMVTQVLTVEAGGQSFGIPLDALLETIRVPARGVSGVGAARVIVHRDRTFPLIDLASELGRGTTRDGEEGKAVTVVLASVSDEIIAFRVDCVGERIEVILKPLEGFLAGLKGITGTTLLGDGRVLLVLDLWELLA